MSKLPQYQCHKKVRAGRIIKIFVDGISRATELEIDIGHGRVLGIWITSDWKQKHNPELGGYYVEYEDGYTSYSPAEAFEGGYSLVESI